jgi:hypothetical protein
MRQPLPHELEAIARIAARPEGAVFLEYLQANMSDTSKMLINANDPQITRAAQGEARVLNVLLQVWKP